MVSEGNSADSSDGTKRLASGSRLISEELEQLQEWDRPSISDATAMSLGVGQGGRWS